MAESTTFLTIHTNESFIPSNSTARPISSRVQPKLTEEFLMSLEGIIDASVWMEADGLSAHVTLHDDVPWTERTLKAQCLLGLGAHQTPRSLLMLVAGNPPTHAAVRLARPRNDEPQNLAA